MAQKAMLWARVGVEVKEIVEKLARTKGISMSEYVRSLVLEDLDKRTVFTTILKQGELTLTPLEEEENNERGD